MQVGATEVPLKLDTSKLMINSKEKYELPDGSKCKECKDEIGANDIHIFHVCSLCFWCAIELYDKIVDAATNNVIGGSFEVDY